MVQPGNRKHSQSFKQKKFNTENWYMGDGRAEKSTGDSEATQKIDQEAVTNSRAGRQEANVAL